MNLVAKVNFETPTRSKEKQLKHIISTWSDYQCKDGTVWSRQRRYCLHFHGTVPINIFIMNFFNISIGDFIVWSNHPARILKIHYDTRYCSTKFLIQYIDDAKPEEWVSEQELKSHLLRTIDGNRFKRNINVNQSVCNQALSSPFLDVHRIKWKFNCKNRMSKIGNQWMISSSNKCIKLGQITIFVLSLVELKTTKSKRFQRLRIYA